MTRREVLISAIAAAVGTAATSESKMSVEGYIFQQYAEFLKKPLKDVVAEVIPMARAAGFRNIELNPAFFALDMREHTLSLVRSQRLKMPSLYVGGAMHTKDGADRTIADALEYGKLCAPFGCRGIVNNPDPKAHDEPKTDAELQVEADSLNRMGRTLADHGFELRVHHHTPQLEQHAREWHFILAHTEPRVVHICVDVDWAYEGGYEPIAFLRKVGNRLREIHVRSARNKIWLEDVEDSDIDYRQVAAYLKKENLKPLIVVELAYRPQTKITRPLEEDLRLSRIYTEKIFGVTVHA